MVLNNYEQQERLEQPPSAVEIQAMHGVRAVGHQAPEYTRRIEVYSPRTGTSCQTRELRVISSEVCGLKYCVPGLYQD